MTDKSVISSGNFRLAQDTLLADYSADMAGKPEADAARKLLLELVERQEDSLSRLSEEVLGRNRSYLENFVRKGSPRELAHEDRQKLGRALSVHPDKLRAVIHRPSEPVASGNHKGVASRAGDERTGFQYQALTELIPVIGRVQAGAWREAYQFQEELEPMRLPPDPRYPGIPRYALVNSGNSMNRVCRDGGAWVFVRFHDLTGQGPSVGQYVIVERLRRDGMIEATAKQFRIGPDGKPWLYPDSDDPTFEPFPLTGGGDIEEIRVIGRVVEIVNRV